MDRRVLKVTGIIDETYPQKLSPSTLAKRAGVSRRQLDRLFRAETGLTVCGYLKQKRLTQAAQLLRRTQLRISEVAYETGFNNAEHFGRLFKGHFGHSPGEFRNGPKKSTFIPPGKCPE